MYLDREQTRPDGRHITLSPSLQNAGLHSDFFLRFNGLACVLHGFWVLGSGSSILQRFCYFKIKKTSRKFNGTPHSNTCVR